MIIVFACPFNKEAKSIILTNNHYPLTVNTNRKTKNALWLQSVFLFNFIPTR